MNTVVVGAYWGDEGKGKIVDLLASEADWIVRYNGGDNAGHTIVIGDKKVVLHILPAGVLQGKNAAIGPDVFFNPASFIKDLKHVQEKGFKIKGKIVIDERAHVIMPYHIGLDSFGSAKIGTTKKGIGPCAMDKAQRTTDISVADMYSDDFLQKIKAIVNEKKNELIAKEALKSHYDINKYCEKTFEVYTDYAQRIKQYVGETTYLLNEAVAKGKSVMLEGAQGTLLDVVHGTRPYVTSSNTTAGGASANLGIDIRNFKVIGIAKAYPTRVGEGHFVTELGDYESIKNTKEATLNVTERKKAIDGDSKLLGRWIRLDGAEYGATTGRPRRTGNPDFVALKYCAMINGVNEWAITKIDVLGGKPFRAATAYKNGKTISQKFPFRLEGWEPVYGKEYHWQSMPEKETKEAVINGYDSLPSGMKEYIKDLVQYTKVPVSMISVSPKRDMTVVKDVLRRTKEYLK